LDTSLDVCFPSHAQFQRVGVKFAQKKYKIEIVKVNPVWALVWTFVSHLMPSHWGFAKEMNAINSESPNYVSWSHGGRACWKKSLQVDCC
jgi:hypothetical protein